MHSPCRAATRVAQGSPVVPGLPFSVLVALRQAVALATLKQLVVHPLAALPVVAIVQALVERLQLELAVFGDVRGRLLH